MNADIRSIMMGILDYLSPEEIEALKERDRRRAAEKAAAETKS